MSDDHNPVGGRQAVTGELVEARGAVDQDQVVVTGEGPQGLAEAARAACAGDHELVAYGAESDARGRHEVEARPKARRHDVAQRLGGTGAEGVRELGLVIVTEVGGERAVEFARGSRSTTSA